MSRDIFNLTRLLRALPNLALNVSRDGASTTSSANLCQGFTTLIVKNIFLISSLNPPYFSLKPLPLDLLQRALLKSLSPSFLQPHFQVPEGCSKVSPEPALLQAGQSQLSHQHFLIAEVFQPSDHFCGLLWTRSNRSIFFLCWGLQRWTQDSR